MNNITVRGKVVIVVLVGVNAALAVALWSLLHGPLAFPADREANSPVTLTTSGPVRIAKTNVILRARTLTWRDLESTNYDLYVLNLRGIGCPEPTVRDIILADVNQLYARKRRELNITTNDLPWWRSEPDLNETHALLAKTAALEEERRKLLARLLGPNWDDGPDAEPEPLVLAGPTLSALTPEQKQAVQDLVTRSQRAVSDYVKQCQKKGESPNPAEMARLRETVRLELEQKLTAPQTEEFLLRYSHNASQLRDQLRGLNTTPDEFRQLFTATDTIDRQLLALAEGDPSAMLRRQELLAQREAAIQQALSPERYEAYQMLKDADYRLAMNDAQEAGAPAQAGRTLYELNQAAASERDRIRNDPSLTPAEKEEQLKEVELERLAARAQALGLAPPSETRPKPPPPFRYSTIGGESVVGLALQYRVSLSDLLQANPGLSDSQIMQPGQMVNIPQKQTPLPQPVPAIRGPFDKAGVPPEAPPVPLVPVFRGPFDKAGQ